MMKVRKTRYFLWARCRGESQHEKIYRVPLASANRATQPEKSAFRVTLWFRFGVSSRVKNPNKGTKTGRRIALGYKLLPRGTCPSGIYPHCVQAGQTEGVTLNPPPHWPRCGNKR